MSLVGTMSSASNLVQAGSGALSLLGATKVFLAQKGIGGFLFDDYGFELNDQVQLSAQITDHYNEDNQAIQDHVAIEPVKITITGLVSELIYTKSAAEEYAQEVIDRLGPLGVFSGKRTQSAQSFLSQVSRTKSAVTSVVNGFKSFASLFSEDYGRNNQQNSFHELENLFNYKQIITVATPWKTFKNMIIESLGVEQDETTKEISTFTVVLKEMRFASTATSLGKLLGRIQAQKSPTENKGVSPGQSILSQGADAVGNVLK